MFGPMALLFAGTMASRWSSHGGPHGGPRGGGEHRGGGRKRRRMFAQGELRLVLLKLIADEPRHGYELIKAIEEMTGGSYSPSPGTIYPTLSLLEDEGVIAPAADGESRKAYHATDAGRVELDERSEEVDAIMERLCAQGEESEPLSSPDLFRAVGNLASVLRNRARSGRLNEDTVREIVDLVDDLAKKVERL
ncbi:PadR family transcriptional regulator [Qipengyuania zhejiangensis]|uniref:PadR family transcriptional regulator n=1 Tax=Qipengyuania zhejiangensis TaxID=3077782 RepID=UPI002D768083|nr:PadR family transcriptional regulator [Qipengyuania sp. Z2]